MSDGTYPSIPGFTRFDIPISRDKWGGVEVKACVVSDNLLPVMADIIDAATKPTLLTQRYEFHNRRAVLADDQWEALRDRIQYDLEHALREEAKKLNLCVITAVSFKALPVADVVLFTASATAMRLLEKGIER